MSFALIKEDSVTRALLYLVFNSNKVNATGVQVFKWYFRLKMIFYADFLHTFILFKGIVSRDWKGLQMVSLDRFEV
jgi:hypothetical protein